MNKEQLNDSLKNSDKNFNENCTLEKEQIIIDGVDVTGCNYIITHNPPKEQGTWGGAIHKGACKIYSKDCKYNPDCYFKQLIRKTQECEEYKKRAVCFKDVNKQLGYKYLTIKDECEELKEKLACQININNHLADYQVTANKLMDYYRKALEEIENNINKYFEESFYKNCRYAKECTKACGLATNSVLNKTLNIINKAKGEE